MAHSAALAWTDDYAVGVVEVDAQHRALLDILNQVNRSGSGHVPGLWKTFEELNAYAAYHFLSEEKLMREHLPEERETARHIAAHRNYWVTIADFKRRHQDGEDGVAGQLVAFLNAWWIDHIQGIDRQMGANLRQRGVR